MCMDNLFYTHRRGRANGVALQGVAQTDVTDGVVLKRMQEGRSEVLDIHSQRDKNPSPP
jgi:hypothetical protein